MHTAGHWLAVKRSCRRSRGIFCLVTFDHAIKQQLDRMNNHVILSGNQGVMARVCLVVHLLCRGVSLNLRDAFYFKRHATCTGPEPWLARLQMQPCVADDLIPCFSHSCHTDVRI